MRDYTACLSIIIRRSTASHLSSLYFSSHKIWFVIPMVGIIVKIAFYEGRGIIIAIKEAAASTY